MTIIKPDENVKLPGAKSDAGKLDLTQVPPEIIKAVAVIRDYGNRKYAAPDNWESVDPQRFWAALLRHVLSAWKDWRRKDSESGFPHLWHIACNTAFLCAFLEGTDDG